MSLFHDTPIRLRAVEPGDWSSVLLIEQASYPHSPWTRDRFGREMAGYAGGLKGIVADASVWVAGGRGGKVLGYVVHRFTFDRIDILNLAVHRQHRGAGVGSWLLGKVVELLEYPRIMATMTIRESNLPAQKFMRACGIKAILPIRTGYYTDTREDGYLFAFTAACFRPEAVKPPKSSLSRDDAKPSRKRTILFHDPERDC